MYAIKNSIVCIQCVIYVIGISLTYIILSLITIWDIDPWFLLIAYIPYACCGGFCIILLGTICYLTDISNEQERGWQLAWMEALISVGILTGILAGPIIFQAYGYTVVFVIATVCCIVAGLCICIFVPETTYSTDSVCIYYAVNIFAIVIVNPFLMFVGNYKKFV